MSKKSKRRVVKEQQAFSYAESSSDSDDYGCLEMFTPHQHSNSRGHRNTTFTSRTKSSKKTKERARSILNVDPKGIRAQTVTEVSQLIPNNVIKLDDSVIANQSKIVEEKVESFFKVHNLISDDEDAIGNHLNKPKYPCKETKEFYELSDSDDDVKVFVPQPSALDDISKQSQHEFKERTGTLQTNIHEVVDLIKSQPSKEDELMDVVDKILQSTDCPIESFSQRDQSWSEYKNKTEEILGNISNLLNEISNDTKPNNAETEPQKSASPSQVKHSCPVCFDRLNGDTIAMATTCGHIFCKPCIGHVAKTSKKCPTCRKVVNQKKIHRIYL